MSKSLIPDFANPPNQYLPRPLWFWNGKMTSQEIQAQIGRAMGVSYSGFGVVPAHDMSTAFMSEEFLDLYADAVQTAADAGGRVCLYDEFWFPSGAAGGHVADEYPDALSKRLDMHAIDISGSARYTKPVPDGQLMSAVAMNIESLERIDLLDSIEDGWLNWHVPEGRWRVMFFLCVVDGAKGLIDYLDPLAVDAFIELTYEKYYNRFPEHFGKTIDVAFYDEPTFHWVEGGRVWTPRFNEDFESHFGYSPTVLYPALWYNIGAETAAARCALFGLRAELFSTSFVRRLNDWCLSKGIFLTGHVDQEEVSNPVGMCGDLMKTFQHQDIPAFDQIFRYGRARRAAKVVTSAANNYDRQLVVCEAYGATEDLDATELYREAIDLFSRGMNVLIPHAMWYDAEAMPFPPDVSPTDSTFGPYVKEFNTWVGRVQSILQRGRHVSDIGMLYPIDSMMAAYRFDGGGDPYTGGLVGAEAAAAETYLEAGDALFTQVHRDFTYVHPDVLNRCSVGKDADGHTVLQLDNPVNSESYRVFVIPGASTISIENLEILKEFHDEGGVLLAVAPVPDCASGFDGKQPGVLAQPSSPDRRATQAGEPEIGISRKSAQVRETVEQLFGAGGNGKVLLRADADSLRSTLDKHAPVPDVRISIRSEDPIDTSGGHVSYQHKIIGDTHIYFIGNSTDQAVDVDTQIRGHLDLQLWDPRDGSISAAETINGDVGGEPVTKLNLTLGPVQAIFAVSL